MLGYITGAFSGDFGCGSFFSIRNINGICQVSGFAISVLHRRFFQLLGIQSDLQPHRPYSHHNYVFNNRILASELDNFLCRLSFLRLNRSNPFVSKATERYRSRTKPERKKILVLGKRICRWSLIYSPQKTKKIASPPQAGYLLFLVPS